MKIAGLSEATGVSVATLKYYLREGLLHPGAAMAVNQAAYDASHVRRVKLVRALLDLGRMSIADVRAVLDAVDDESVPIHTAFGRAQDALVPSRPRDGEAYAAARAEVDAFVRRHGLDVRPDAAVRDMLADALVFIAEFAAFTGTAGARPDARLFDAMVPDAVAGAEFGISLVPDPAPRSDQLEFTVVGTVAYELATAAIRRMAFEHASAHRFPPPAKRRR